MPVLAENREGPPREAENLLIRRGISRVSKFQREFYVVMANVIIRAVGLVILAKKVLFLYCIFFGKMTPAQHTFNRFSLK